MKREEERTCQHVLITDSKLDVNSKLDKQLSVETDVFAILTNFSLVG